MKGWLVLYDGGCGFCQGSVRFVLRRDRAARFQFAPLEGPTAAAVFLRHGLKERPESVVLVLDPGGSEERIYLKSQAALGIGARLPWPWPMLAWLGRLPPAAWSDRAYDFLARHRRRLSPACPLPTTAQRGRFLP